MDSKSNLRIKAKEIRKTLNIQLKSRQAAEKIRQSEKYKTAKHVLIYYPLKYEINLLNLLKDNKSFYLPKINNNEIQVCPYSDKLVLSKYNTSEPCTNPINPDILDLIIVPALMADKNHNRLGYGGGFYDRFLSNFPNINTILPIYKELFVDNLPTENFDMKISEIIIV